LYGEKQVTKKVTEFQKVLKEIEECFFLLALKISGHNVTETSRVLGISRTKIYEKNLNTTKKTTLELKTEIEKLSEKINHELQNFLNL
jgi:DNA-binding NtrC family response regulator